MHACGSRLLFLHQRRIVTLPFSVVYMDVSDCTRKTVDKDPQALPSIQIYIDPRNQVWHDLDYVFQYFEPSKIVTRKDNFFRDCKSFWSKAQIPDGHRYLRTPDMRVTAARNTCTTFALCIMMWSEIAIGRNGVAARTKLLSIMGFMCVRICEVINHCPCINAGQSPFPGG